jgi:hypothetical protein
MAASLDEIRALYHAAACAASMTELPIMASTHVESLSNTIGQYTTHLRYFNWVEMPRAEEHSQI